jgi:hypothetical protein
VQLLDEVIESFGFRADDAMLAAHEAEQSCQVQVPQAMDLVQQIFIRHLYDERDSQMPWEQAMWLYEVGPRFKLSYEL